MSSKQGAMDTDIENCNLDNQGQPMVEIEEDQADTTNSVPNQQDGDNTCSVPDDQAGDNTTPQLSGQDNQDDTLTLISQIAGNAIITLNPRINDAHLNGEGGQIDLATLSDRVPDMYVRISNRITDPAYFELICTRFFLESWRGEASALPPLNDITLENELLPEFQYLCATPDCDCEE